MSSSIRIIKSGQVEYVAEAAVCETPDAGYSCRLLPAMDQKPQTENDAGQAPPEAELAAPDPQEILQAARDEAERMISAAQAEAAACLEQAQLQSAELKQAALADGQAEGYVAGQRDGLQMAQHLVTEAKQLLAAARAKSDELISAAETDLVEAAIKIAERIIEREVALDPNLVLRTVRKALQGINQRENLILKVAPQDVQLLAQADLLSLGAENVRIVEDPQLQPGECVIDGSHGRLDATFATQLATIKRKFEVVNGV